ncbi:MAG: P1 family peptidase [Pseudomonadota bacterium]
MRAGARNLITDVAGLRVGNAEDHRIKTGVTVLTADAPFVASAHIMGGAPGTRDTELLSPETLVQTVDALVLSGGSAFGLDAAAGVMAGLRAQGRGFRIHEQSVPIVPAAIIFDLANGGDKAWADSPYPALGRAALEAIAQDFEIGTIGAGTGAITANLKGGLGSASALTDGGVTVGALVAANPVGQVTAGDTAEFWAGAFEEGTEFGGHGPATAPPDWYPTKVEQRGHTTIAIVATDLALTQAQAKRLAMMAQDGIARAVVPAHTPFDGDLVFGVSTGAIAIDTPDRDLIQVGHAAATCLARAIARAIYAATPAPGDPYPTWHQRFGG